jgi:hypothetical protein
MTISLSEDACFIGIDFSGASQPWRPQVRNPTVWIATICVHGERLALDDLHPVQNLPGSGDAFAKLVNWLGGGKFAAAAIDAPFSIPAIHIPEGSHAELVRRVGWMSLGHERPFPTGAQLVTLANSVSPITSPKPYRICDSYWVQRGVNVRSTLWNGPRGGAPLTAACLALIAWTGLPCWPWSRRSPMLVEAFPAAQLRHWGLPYEGYAGSTHEIRREIVNAFARRLNVPTSHRYEMLESADALDAVLAAFAAVAVCRDCMGVPPPDVTEEGWIAIYE